MRRVSRPPRALDPFHSVSSSIRQRASLSPCTHHRIALAAFSTSTPRLFLLPGKQDKKKHQQFVRRWQKRLLGESEPIGAHVDPYDPTSPVRIAPEEQGEYEEVLDQERPGRTHGQLPLYTPAEKGRKLLHVGGGQWLRQKLEGEMAKEFEKLTLRTYTPLTLELANEIEELTGTPYTLRDENLMMAQTVHEVTGRPYTNFDFGLHRKTTVAQELRSRFKQAVAEVFALKQAGLDMDLSKSPNKGVYDPPRWVRDIKFHRTESGELALDFPNYKSAEQFVQVIQFAPEWESALAQEAELEDIGVLDPSVPQAQPPIMDPDTPSFKRQAVVKMDPEKKLFDFMSNRPVPRAKPVEQATVERSGALQATMGSSNFSEFTAAVEASRSALNGLRHSVLEHRAERLTNNILALRASLQLLDIATPSATQREDAKWWQISITDVAVKFALFKRLLQLTGLRISDPQITSANTLGELYGFLCAAAKPQPTSLFSALHIEGQKARERAKKHTAVDVKSRKRANLGDLINLGNVELHRVKPSKTDRRTKTGLEKVVQYALWERGLGDGQSQRSTNRGNNRTRIVEGTRQAPEFGKPLSSRGAKFLSKKTKEWREQQERLPRVSVV